MNLDSVAGPLSQAHVLIVLLLILLLLEFSFKGGHSLGGISKVSSRLIQVVLRRPSSPLDQVVDHIFDPPLVQTSSTSHSSLGSSKSGIIIRLLSSSQQW